jgi:hypothetical protein
MAVRQLAQVIVSSAPAESEGDSTRFGSGCIVCLIFKESAFAGLLVI